MITTSKTRRPARRLAGRAVRGHRSRRGFTIVELIVAMIVLTVGVLGLASTAATVSRMVGGGAQQAQAANVAQSRLERLRNVSWQCANITGGSAVTRGMTETWVVQAVPGTTRAVRVDLTVKFKTTTHSRTTNSHQRVQSYRSLILCN